MKFPFVRRSTYNRLMGLARELNDEVIRLKIENETLIGNACQLAANERALRGGQ